MYLIIYKTNPKEKEEKGVPLVLTIIPGLIVLKNYYRQLIFIVYERRI